MVGAALTEYAATYTNDRWQTYLATHGERYQRLIQAAARILATTKPRDGSFWILDIGPRFEVDLLRRLARDARVDTLGIDSGPLPRREGDEHHTFDLGQTDDPAARPAIGPYDLVVMAEVLEHVPMPPSVVLPWLRSILRPRGHLLIQTPNAVALQNRLRMLTGRQPFQPLSADRSYPGHFREYTVNELVVEAQAAGFRVAHLETGNYFMSSKRSNQIFHRAERFVPRNLRAGITLTLTT
jgi:SAM-dependent methyltransferase